MKLLRLLLAVSLLVLPACQTATPQTPVAAAATETKPVPGKYLAADAIDLRALLPDPPAPHSPYSDGEIDLIRTVQADAAPASITRAIAEDKMTVWLFADVLGPDFSPAKKPLTAALIRQAEVDSRPAALAAKKLWARPRPYDQNPAIKPLVDKPNTDSYPSGHTTRAATWAEILVLFAPEKADAIRARARLIGLDRIIAGVHFPSDVAAGNALGKALVDRMKESPAFQADLAQARAEWAH